MRFARDIRGRHYTDGGENMLPAFTVPNDDGYVGISTTGRHRTLSRLFELLRAEGEPVS
jgi:hypothetical protein